MSERGGDEVGRAEARLGGGRGVRDPRHLQGRPVAADAHARDLLDGHAHPRFQRKGAVDGGEGVAAAGVVLESHLRDVEVLVQRGERALPVRVAAHRPTEARFAFHDIERSGQALCCCEGRGDAGFRGAPRVHGLGHRIRAKRLLQAGGESGDRGERMGEAPSVEAEQLGRGARRAETADGSGVVPVPVVSAAHGRGDARGDLVADDHRAQELLARGAARLRDGERSGDGRRPGMVDALAENVVHLECVRGRAVDERRGSYRRAPAQGEMRVTEVQLPGESALEQHRRRNHGSGKQRGVPIDHRAFGVVQHIGRDGPLATVIGKPRETLYHVHGMSIRHRGSQSIVNKAACSSMPFQRFCIRRFSFAPC